MASETVESDDEHDVIDYAKDELASFIEDLPVTRRYFGGQLRLHPPPGPLGSPLLCSAKIRYEPVLSTVIAAPGVTAERYLYAKRVDDDWDTERPTMVCIGGGPARSKANAIFQLTALFTFTAAVGSECSFFLYHSTELYRRHPTPSMAFIREVSGHTTIPVLALAMATPGHNFISLGVLRLFALCGFQSTPMLPFLGEEDFGAWLARQRFKVMSDEDFAAAVAELAPKLRALQGGFEEGDVLDLTPATAEELSLRIWRLRPAQRRRGQFGIVPAPVPAPASKIRGGATRPASARGQTSEMIVAAGKAFAKMSTITEAGE